MAKNIVSISLVAMALFSDSAFAGPAVHINNLGCCLADGSGNFVFSPNQRAVITDSGMKELIGNHSIDR
jgi:hypothetical protein